MRSLSKLFKRENGFAMPMALLLVFIVGVVVTPVVWLVGTNLKTDLAMEQKVKGTYAADSGIQYALWKFTAGVQEGTYVAGHPISFPGDDGGGHIFYEDGAGYLITVSVLPASGEEGYLEYKITSTARDIQTDKSSKIIAYVRSATEPIEGASPFNYALATLGGDLIMTGSSQVSCIPNPPAVSCDAGDVWINGDIYMGWSNVINGVATLVGTVNSPNPNPDIDEIIEGADPIERPTWLDEKTIEYIDSTAVTLPEFGGTCTTWTDSAAVYNNPICINGNMTLGQNGTYRFKDTVWVKGNLVIQSGTNHIYFEDSVKVDGNVTFQGNGDVTFINTYMSTESTIDYASYIVGTVLNGSPIDISDYNAIAEVRTGTFGRNELAVIRLQDSDSTSGPWVDVPGAVWNITISNDATTYNLPYTGNKPYIRATAVVTGDSGDYCPFGVSINKNLDTLMDHILYVGGYMYAGGSRSIQFQGQVEVAGGQLSSGYAINIGGAGYGGVSFDVDFWSTIRAGDDLHFGSGRVYRFDDVIYTTGNLVMDGYSGSVSISDALVADGSIFISSSAYIYTDYLSAPFLISRKVGCCTDASNCNATCDGVCLTGNVPVTAIIYAPDSRAYVSGSSSFNGAMVAKCARLDGNVILNYPVILDNRDDLEDPNIGIASDFELVSYSIK